MAARKRLATAADLAALNRETGPVVMRFPAHGGRARLSIPAPLWSKPPKGRS